MRFIFFTFIFLSCMLRVHAQSQVQADTFNVRAVNTTITVLPERYYMFVNEDYYFKIKYSGKNKMGHVEYRGGTVDKKDSLWHLKATGGTSAILVVYEKLKNGTERIAFTWTYKLFSRETPEVKLDGIPNDSVIDKLTVIALGKLRATQKYGHDSYTITSFKVYFKNGNHFDTLSAKGNQMSLQMKQRVDSMDVKKNGGILMFEDIKAVDPNGKEIDLPPLRIYIQDAKKNGVGL